MGGDHFLLIILALRVAASSHLQFTSTIVESWGVELVIREVYVSGELNVGELC